MPFERELKVHFSHCDPAGIVFFPQYLVMLNDFVETWFNEGLGIDYAQLLGARRIGVPTVRLECDFTAPSRMGDRITLGLAVERLGRASFTLAYACRQEAELRFKARQVLVTTSLATHAAIAIPPDVRQAIAHFTEQDTDGDTA